MATSCKGTCNRFRAESVQNKIRYILGHKRCSYCLLYLRVTGINCPCCGAKLRSHARNKKRKNVDDASEGVVNAPCGV